MEFSRQENWSGLPFLSPGDLPHTGIELRSPALRADSSPSEPPGKPWMMVWTCVLALNCAQKWLKWCILVTYGLSLDTHTRMYRYVIYVYMYFKANLLRMMAMLLFVTCFMWWTLWHPSARQGLKLLPRSYLAWGSSESPKQRSPKVWMVSAVPKAFRSQVTIPVTKGCSHSAQGAWAIPGRTGAEQAGKPVLDTDSKASSRPEVQPDNPEVTYLVMKRTKIPNIWSHWDVWGFVKEQRQPFKISYCWVRAYKWNISGCIGTVFWKQSGPREKGCIRWSVQFGKHRTQGLEGLMLNSVSLNERLLLSLCLKNNSPSFFASLWNIMKVYSKSYNALLSKSLKTVLFFFSPLEFELFHSVHEPKIKHSISTCLITSRDITIN